MSKIYLLRHFNCEDSSVEFAFSSRELAENKLEFLKQAYSFKNNPCNIEEFEIDKIDDSIWFRAENCPTAYGFRIYTNYLDSYEISEIEKAGEFKYHLGAYGEGHRYQVLVFKSRGLKEATLFAKEYFKENPF